MLLFSAKLASSSSHVCECASAGRVEDDAEGRTRLSRRGTGRRHEIESWSRETRTDTVPGSAS